MLVTRGLSMESFLMFITTFPCSPISSCLQLFAAWVASPSCAAQCFASEAALANIFCTASVGAVFLAPALARMSTRRFARQSTIVSREPSGSMRSPTALMDKCAGIHVRAPCSISMPTSPSRLSAMLRQSLARGLEASVTQFVPCLAADKIERQSVFMRGGQGLKGSTKSMAHRSAAAAVLMRLGGEPKP